MRKRKLIAIIIITLIFGLLIYKVNADVLYSIDTNHNTLVTIDTSSLVITEIGPLEVDPDETDGLVVINENNLLGILIFKDERKYGRYEFYKIDTTTGHATFLAKVIDGDSDPDVNLAEGLAKNIQTGEIYISYSSGAESSSDLVGTVDPTTGIITKRCTIGVDMDTLTFNTSGVLFANDTKPLSSLDFYNIDLNTCTSDLIGSFPATDDFNGITGMQFLKDGSLVALTYARDEERLSLVEVNPMTGEIVRTIGPIQNGFHIRELCTNVNLPSPVPGCDLTPILDVLKELNSKIDDLETKLNDIKSKVETGAVIKIKDLNKGVYFMGAKKAK